MGDVKPVLREKGFYWVKHKQGEWTICWWGGQDQPEWFFIGQEHTTYSDDQFAEIDEKQLTRR